MLIAFDGEVQCRSERGAIHCSLRGHERHGGEVEVLLAAAGLPDGPAPQRPLPARLNEVGVFELDAPPGARRLLLVARELQQPLAARSVQLHRDVAPAFFSAVPPLRVPYLRRLGWALLLRLLRWPGAGRLLLRLRGNR